MKISLRFGREIFKKVCFFLPEAKAKRHFCIWQKKINKFPYMNMEERGSGEPRKKDFFSCKETGLGHIFGCVRRGGGVGPLADL